MFKTKIITAMALTSSLLTQTTMAANGNPMTETKVREIVVNEVQTNPAAKGPKGDTGATGAQGLQGATGAQGPQGAKGAQGPQGATGAQGPQGATGPQGPAGADGNDATVNLTAGSGISLTGNSPNYTIAVTAASPSIGDALHGGVVACLYNGISGYNLIASTSDDDASIVWSNISNDEIGVVAQSDTAGARNTYAILAQAGFTNGAAKICRDKKSGGYTDWYLPSRQELRCLQANKGVLNSFQDTLYWSSTEADAFSAWRVDFTDGGTSIGNNSKGLAHRVRCVRAFTPN